MEEIFKEINRSFIVINKKDKKCNTAVLYSVLETLIDKMQKCDKLFSNMNPRLDYLGSYFDGIRVGHPTEYDINIVLKIPVNYQKIILDSSNLDYCYTSIILPSEFRRLSKTPETINKGFEKTLLWCNKAHCLSVNKFRSWMQSVVDTTLNTLPVKEGKRILHINKNYYYIYSKTSGPATTICIITDKNTSIDVDLVPTFSFDLTIRPKESKVLFSKVSSLKLKQYFLVPKPTDHEFSWRLSFPNQERLMMKGKNNLKSTIRLLKHLRDVQGFKKLSSYYIKTLFLWEIVPENEKMWQKKSLSYLVLYMLKKLVDCLSQRKILNYWCPEHNLIENIKENTIQNWKNRLAFIIQEIERKGEDNPYIVLEYFGK